MLKSGEFTTKSTTETFELGRKIGESINQTTVILLSGELGAGKTVFAKGVAAGIGIDPDEVTSPTYTLVNQYEGRLRLYHLDLYRLSGKWGETFDLGIDEMCAADNAVVIIEWSERLVGQRLPVVWAVKIVDEGGELRRLIIVN
ncbi:MAG: tRNA (adenosine(37)-N6)-threonylcarbamoyltransferase complex ATPase subunit type 1 TsaE [Acidobacteria bacterium]|nr:tRNA (adenosine(37)-N6)-threonylcarbamoyltransferase complex ATPase subunit type 1 TsaE [Acidobacteriota bacterium]